MLNPRDALMLVCGTTHCQHCSCKLLSDIPCRWHTLCNRCDGAVMVKVRGTETLRLACYSAGMLKLRGLPFSCTKADIMEWFTDLPVAPIASDGCASHFHVYRLVFTAGSAVTTCHQG